MRGSLECVYLKQGIDGMHISENRLIVSQTRFNADCKPALYGKALTLLRFISLKHNHLI